MWACPFFRRVSLGQQERGKTRSWGPCDAYGYSRTLCNDLTRRSSSPFPLFNNLTSRRQLCLRCWCSLRSLLMICMEKRLPDTTRMFADNNSLCRRSSALSGRGVPALGTRGRVAHCAMTMGGYSRLYGVYARSRGNPKNTVVERMQKRKN